MISLTAKTVAQAVAGRLHQMSGKEKIAGLSIDSRDLKPGDLFVALAGQRTHGNRFAEQALAQGAAAVMVDQSRPGYPALVVRNCRIALRRLASFYRQQFKRLKVVGITGSSGKTTVKEMVAVILASHYPTHMSPGNYNNELGLPLSLMGITRQHRFAVLEMGMNGPGQIKQLAALAAPAIGVITNIGDAHIGHFRSKRALANAKLELLAQLIDPAWAILNADDEYCQPWIAKSHAISFGQHPNAAIRITDAKVSASGTQVWLNHQQQCEKIKLKTFGVHHAHNAAAAVATALAAGMTFKAACQALDRYRPQAMMRTEIKRVGHSLVINDTYNSNPQSATAAVDLLTTLPGQGKKIVILGDMLELGRKSQQAHAALGRYVAQAGIDVMIGLGQATRVMIQAGKQAGMKQCYFFAKSDKVLSLLKKMKQERQLILIKGSRGMALERLIPEIKKLYQKGG